MRQARIHVPRTADGELGTLLIAYGKHLFIGRALRERGLAGYEAPTTSALLTAWDLVDSEVFFDVGANIGIYSLLHSAQRPHGVTVAFEPTPDVIQHGKAMTAANGRRVRWEQAAVSDSEGEATFYLSARTDASNSLVSGHRRAKGTVTVPTVTLDRYVESSGLVPSVVKIDVEKHEPAVIRGAARLLTEYRPVVVAEVLPNSDEGGETRRLLLDHGYTAQLLEPPTSADDDAELRDWLFWPGPLPAGFGARFREWYAVVAQCTALEEDHADAEV